MAHVPRSTRAAEGGNGPRTTEYSYPARRSSSRITLRIVDSRGSR